MRRLRNVLGIALLISTLATLLVLGITLYTVNRFQRRLEDMATTDALSSLPNRRSGEILFEQAMHNAKRFKQPLSAVVVDLDQFKSINDTRGHLAGDVVIQKVSALLREVVRQSDIVARWGGEEFLVLMSGCPPKEALQWSEKMRVRIETHDFALQPAETITASFGVASLRENDSREELFARADAALYAAKSQGRNRVVAADDA